MNGQDSVITFTKSPYCFNIDSVPTIDVQVSRRLLVSLYQLPSHSNFTNTIPNLINLPAIITFKRAVMKVGQTRAAWPSVRWRRELWWNNRCMTSGSSGGEDGASRQKKVELFVPNLKQILRVKLNRWVSRQVQDTLNKAAVLADDIQREPAALEIVEYPRVVAGDVHPPTEAREIHIHCRFLAVASQHNRVGLHVVLEIFALELGKSCLHFTITARGSSRHCAGTQGRRAGLNVGHRGLAELNPQFDSPWAARSRLLMLKPNLNEPRMHESDCRNCENGSTEHMRGRITYQERNPIQVSIAARRMRRSGVQ